MKEEKLTSVKRFGTRYGRTLKLKYGQIEVEQRKKHKCPYCAAVKVKRQAAGIWNCQRCKAKFTARAYTLQKKVVEAKVESSSSSLEEPQEEQADEEQEA